MHLKDDMLRAFSDKEIPAAQSQRVSEHLARCADCQARLEVIQQRAQRVQTHLDILKPSVAEQPQTAQAAFRRFARKPERASNEKETIITMFTKRSIWIALTVLTVMALVFTITPARAWASSLLGLFRVQRVQVVTFDPALAEDAGNRLNENREMVNAIFEDDLEVTEHGDPVVVSSLEEAAEKAGFTPRVPAGLETAKISVEPGMNAIFTIDQPKLQALLDAVGVDTLLPESANGQVVTADVGNSIVVSSGCPASYERSESEDRCIIFRQMYSPEVNAPDDLDVPALGAAMFQFMGLSPEEAQELSQRIDWASTLVLPIPQDEQISYQDVQVDGVPGTLLESQDEVMIIWVRDGIIYGLRTPAGTAVDAVELAGTLK